MRSITPNQWLVALAMPVLFLATLACSITMPSAPQAPLPSLTPSVADADAFEQSFRQAVNQAAQTGSFSATINQQQLSSWLSLRAAAYARQQGYELPMKNLQASLDGGKITLYGVFVQPNVPDTPAQVVFTPTIDGNGQLAVAIQSGQVGVVGLPSSALTDLNKLIKDTLTSQLSQIQGKYKLTTLNIGGGTLTVSGQVVR